MAGLFEHFYWGDFTEKPGYFLIPIVGLEELLRWFRLVIIVVKTVLTIGHAFFPLLNSHFFVSFFPGLVGFAAEDREVALAYDSSALLIPIVIFVIAVCVWFANVALVIVVRKAVALASFCHVKRTFVKRLSCLVVGIWNPDDWFWGEFLIGWVRGVLVVGPGLKLKIFTNFSFRHFPYIIKKCHPPLPWS